MTFNNPTITDFQNYYVRDFPYGSTQEYVMDQDIANALQMAGLWMESSSLFPDQNSYTLYFLMLTAHFLVLNLRASSQGISGQYNFLQQSKGVGGVSESFNIPQRILDNPELAMLTKTNYGSQFLFYVLPQLTGQMFSVYGGTRA